MKKSFADIFRENIGYILSVVIVITYILTALMTIDKTDQTVGQILVNSFIILALGVTLSNTLGQQGLNEGDKNEEVILAHTEHKAAQFATQEYWYEADIFCSIKNKSALRQERERMLNLNALKYDDYFDDDGVFIGKFLPPDDNKRMNKVIKRKNNAIEYVVVLEITQITPSDMVSETVKPNDPLGRGRTKKQYQVQTGVRDIFGKVITAVAGGIYTARFLSGNYGEVIYRIIIAVMLLSFAVVKYYTNYRFIITENKDRILTSTKWLLEFEAMHNQGMLKIKEPEIDKVELDRIKNLDIKEKATD